MDEKYQTTPPPTFIDRRAASSVLDERHLTTFQRAIRNILTSQIAEETFAQIIDGLPLADVAFGTRGHWWKVWDPVKKHETLCAGVLEQTRSIRETFDPAELPIDNRVLQQYQNVPDGSSASRLPLFELVAVTIHAMAVALYAQDHDHHKDCNLMGEAPSQYGRTRPPILSPFSLSGYDDPSQYPDGAKEFPGYWAEDRIFGGVVLFERGANGDESKDIWYHSFRRDITRRIYALTSEQKLDLYHFLRADSDNLTESPLPILANRTNREHVDADIAMPEHQIYRDRWERKMTRVSYEDFLLRQHDVIDPKDFPELHSIAEDLSDSVNTK